MEIKKITPLESAPEYQEYSSKDVTLIEQKDISAKFTLFSEDYIEYFIEDKSGNLIASNYDAYTYKPVDVNSVDNSTKVLELNPDLDVSKFAIDRGSVDITYNFYSKLFKSDFYTKFWIADISEDRTELRVVRNDLSVTELREEFNLYQQKVEALPYYPDFLLNFGDNQTLIGVNMVFNQIDSDSSLFIKLYEPLPDDFQEKDTFWLVNKLAEPVTYEVTTTVAPETPVSTYKLRGPNFEIDAKKQIGQTTEVYNYNQLFGIGAGALASTSSFNQLKSLLQEKSIDINVDYTDFSNFVHFSSAVERLNNFVYKLSVIEDFQSKISSSANIQGSAASSSRVMYKQGIENLIDKFDEYEYFLYYSNSPRAWPKYQNPTTQQYYPQSITSSRFNTFPPTTSSVEWLGVVDSASPTGSNMLYSASVYDNGNPDYVIGTLPQFIRDDSDNNPGFLFMTMLGHHFDNLYVYYKDITNRFNASNDINQGISKDLVADALRGLGVKLYTNSNNSDSLYYSLLGINPTGSSNVPTGSEKISQIVTVPNLISGSSTEDIQAETYKRIYHNLPYLLKTKGTERGLRALISCFGIPDTMLRINEFGGISDETSLGSNAVHNHYEGLYSRISGSNQWTSSLAALVAPWGPVGFDYLTKREERVPDTFQLRFKSINGAPTESYDGLNRGDSYYSSSAALFHVGTGSAMQWGIQLSYISSTAAKDSPLASLGITGSAVSGSPYENYGYLSLWLSGSAGYRTSSYLYLPFYDKDLEWNIYAYRETSSLTSQSGSDNRYWIYAEAPLYNAEGIATRGFRGSASISIRNAAISQVQASYNAAWNKNMSSSIGPLTSSTEGLYAGYLGGNMVAIKPFASASYIGAFQELRYWRGTLTDEAMAQHAYYAESTVGNNETASITDLVFRLKLSRDQSSASFYYVANTTPQGYVTTDFGNANVSLPSIHPGVIGSFNIPGYGNVKTIPSFYLFKPGTNPEAVNGAAYTSSFFATNYTAYDSYQLVTTPKSGPDQKANKKVFSPTQYQITGSTLSPFVSIEKIDPSKTRNSMNVEVALSPADQIDDDIAGQLGYFDLDDYIGSPSDAYSSSYKDLNTLRNIYFGKYVKAYNVYDLVRAVKFYDNSLFKMIKDFVPMKANLSTGIVIKPHVLERNKTARYEPVLSFVNYSGSLDTAFISGSNGIGQPYSTSFTEVIAGKTGSVTQVVTDNAAMLTGRFGGTTIDIPTTFDQELETSISNTTTVQQYITGSKMNYLFNNVSGSRASVIKADLDYSQRADVPVNLGIVTSLYYTMSQDPNASVLSTGFWPWATVQDSDYTRFTFNSLRSIGSKTSSSLYNTYSLSDANIPSINRSYGKTPAIGLYSKKIGLFTQVKSSTFFTNQNNFELIYLVDESGSFVELNADNRNWEEVQNTFKQGNRATVKLFDNQKYSDQRTTEGVKRIFNSGYSYSPLVYFNQGTDTKLYFSINEDSVDVTSVFEANNDLTPNGNIKGYSTSKFGLTVSGSTNAIYNVYDNVVSNQGDRFVPGTASSNTWPNYTTPSNAAYKFSASLVLSVTASTPGASVGYTLDVISTNPTKVLGSSTQTLINGTSTATLSGQRAYIYTSRAGEGLQTYAITASQGLAVYDSSNTIVKDYYPPGTILYLATGSTSLYFPTATTSSIGKDMHILYATSSGFTASILTTFASTNVTGSVTGNTTTVVGNPDSAQYYYIDNALIYERGGNITGSGPFTAVGSRGTSNSLLYYNVSTDNIPLVAGTQIQYRLYETSNNSQNYTASIATAGNADVSITTQIEGLYPYATSSTTDASIGTFISRSIFPNTFVLNKELSKLYGYQFEPGFTSGSDKSSSLYTTYGDTDSSFSASLGDVLIVRNGVYSQEFDILKAETISGSIWIEVSPTINDIFIKNLPETASFIAKVQDESNLILRFPKKSGATSYGIVIPDNISPDILKNIDTITKEIQQKLIDSNGFRQDTTSTTSTTSTSTDVTPTPTPTPTPTGPTPTPTPTPAPATYYKLNACGGSGEVLYTTIAPSLTNQRYYKVDTGVYYIWDNTTSPVGTPASYLQIVSSQQNCP